MRERSRAGCGRYGAAAKPLPRSAAKRNGSWSRRRRRRRQVLSLPSFYRGGSALKLLDCPEARPPAPPPRPPQDTAAKHFMSSRNALQAPQSFWQAPRNRKASRRAGGAPVRRAGGAVGGYRLVDVQVIVCF